MHRCDCFKFYGVFLGIVEKCLLICSLSIRLASLPGVSQVISMADFDDFEPPVRILVAEHHEIMEAIALAQRSGESCIATAVRNGDEAMHLLLGNAFDLAIVDLSMRSLDALRLIALIRATPELRHLPILAVASAQSPASAQEALKAGASDYVQRPVDWPQVVMRIRNLADRAPA